MKIAVLKGPRSFEVVEEGLPEIAPDEVLLRVAACGVCTSELETWNGGGEYPRYLGHEVSGVVEKVGSAVQGFRPGDAVAAWVLTRGYAEYVAVKAEFVLPARVPLEQALAEPLACAVNAVELADPLLSDDVVIIGAGFMGNLVQKLVQLRGPRHLIVADTRADALERALRMGATHVVNVTKENLKDVVRGLTDGKGADVSFEVTGAQGPLTLLGEVTRMSGKVAIVGYHQGEPRQIPMGYWNWMAFQIINAHFRDINVIMRGMRVGMRLLNSGRIDLSDLVTHRFGLDQINDAFRTSYEKPEGFVKSVVSID